MREDIDEELGGNKTEDEEEGLPDCSEGGDERSKHRRYNDRSAIDGSGEDETLELR